MQRSFDSTVLAMPSTDTVADEDNYGFLCLGLEVKTSGPSASSFFFLPTRPSLAVGQRRRQLVLLLLLLLLYCFCYTATAFAFASASASASADALKRRRSTQQTRTVVRFASWLMFQTEKSRR
jgi:hypothetical protein